VFDAEESIIISKIDSAKVYDGMHVPRQFLPLFRSGIGPEFCRGRESSGEYDEVALNLFQHAAADDVIK
jgi:hypothetical protein